MACQYIFSLVIFGVMSSIAPAESPILLFLRARTVFGIYKYFCIIIAALIILRQKNPSG